MSADNTDDLAALLRLSRAQLHACADAYFKAGGGTEPEVALVACGSARAIFKDYARTPGWFGRLLAPVLLWREASALATLDGMVGIPKLYRRIDSRGLIMEYLPATPWPQAKASDAAYTRLATLVDAMHTRGVAHCDLRAPSNMLVGDDGTPYIVDFVARMRRGQRWNLPWNWLFHEFVRADESALAKLRVRFAPKLATDDDRALLEQRGPLERFARGLGAGIRRLVRFFVRTA